MTTKNDDTNAPSSADIERFLKLLSTGRKNGRHAVDLCPILRCDDRTLRDYARYARKSGYAVCSGNPGYWLAANLDEVSETCGRLRSQGRDMIADADDLQAAASKAFGWVEEPEFETLDMFKVFGMGPLKI